MDVARTFPAAPDDAWALLSRTAAWPAWGPSVAAVDPADEVVREGLQGRVRTPIGAWLPFTIDAVDERPDRRRWSWRVAGVPATAHRVEAVEAGCRVVFEVPVLAAGYALVCRAALGRLGGLLAEHEAVPERS